MINISHISSEFSECCINILRTLMTDILGAPPLKFYTWGKYLTHLTLVLALNKSPNLSFSLNKSRLLRYLAMQVIFGRMTLFQVVSQGPGFPTPASKLALGLISSSRSGRGRGGEVCTDHTWTWYASPLLSFCWLELRHMPDHPDRCLSSEVQPCSWEEKEIS